VYVDDSAVGANDGASWTDAFADLQDGLAAASVLTPRVKVRVAKGIYYAD